MSEKKQPIYMLNCDNCGTPYESSEGFPKVQWCPKCNLDQYQFTEDKQPVTSEPEIESLRTILLPRIADRLVRERTVGRIVNLYAAQLKYYQEVLDERAQTILNHINNPNHSVHIMARQEERAKVIEECTAQLAKAKKEGYKQGVDDQHQAQQMDIKAAKEQAIRDMLDSLFEPCPHRAHNAKYFKPRSACPKCMEVIKATYLKGFNQVQPEGQGEVHREVP